MEWGVFIAIVMSVLALSAAIKALGEVDRKREERPLFKNSNELFEGLKEMNNSARIDSIEIKMEEIMAQEETYSITFMYEDSSKDKTYHNVVKHEGPRVLRDPHSIEYDRSYRIFRKGDSPKSPSAVINSDRVIGYETTPKERE